MEFIREGYKLYSLGCEALSIAKVHTERNNCSEVEHQEYIGGKKWKFITHDQEFVVEFNEDEPTSIK